jgi:hypothetical protein
MKLVSRSICASLGFALATGAVLAQDAEITMQVIEGELPEAVTRQIVLPPEADAQAVDDSAFGLSTANEARKRREGGLNTARDALEQSMIERNNALEQARSLSEHRLQTGGRPPFAQP